MVTFFNYGVNLIGDDVITIEWNADVLLSDFKDIDVAVYTGQTKNMEVRHN